MQFRSYFFITGTGRQCPESSVDCAKPGHFDRIRFDFGYAFVSIRGQGNLTPLISEAPAVAAYIDGVYVPRPSQPHERRMFMRAVRFHNYDGLTGVTIDEVAKPIPRSGEVLVRVRAAGLNPFDRYAVEGYVNAFVTFTLPAILGRDFSGVVEAIGPGVTEFAVGDAVFGQAAADADGTFADYVAIPAARAARKPASLSHIEAASFPNVLMAAWDGLFSATTGLDLKPGQTILVNGAAGGIGNVATQLAVWHGANVIGTASAANLDLLAEFGAEPRDYGDATWLDGIGPIDGVLDTADGSSADRICEVIRPGGHYVALRGFPSETFADRWAERASSAGWRADRTAWVAGGRWPPR